jgi:hypothetical protein
VVVFSFAPPALVVHSIDRSARLVNYAVINCYAKVLVKRERWKNGEIRMVLGESR